MGRFQDNFEILHFEKNLWEWNSFCKQLLMYSILWGANSGIDVLIKEHPAPFLWAT